MTATDIARVHERLDDLFHEVGVVRRELAEMAGQCAPCRATIAKHDRVLYGNGSPGLTAKLASAGRDTMSVKGLVAVIGAVGGMAAAIGAAMASVIR